jgi:hypothetical protein
MTDDRDTTASRAQALQSLVELRTPLDDAIAELAHFEWDSDEDLATLTRADALRLLDRYLQHTMTADECQRWADALEGRDDLGFETGSEDLIKEFLFQIATPELAEPLTKEFAERWLGRLSKATDTV